MKQAERILINSVSNYFGLAAFGIVNVVLVGYLVRYLGKSAFGAVCLVISMTAITELFGTGFSTALTKQLSASLQKDSEVVCSKLMNSAFLWFLICGITGAIIILTVSMFASHLFTIPPELLNQAKIALVLIAARSLFFFPFNCYRGVLFSLQRYDVVNLAKVLTLAFRLTLIIVYFEVYTGNIVAVVIITLISLAIERIVWVKYVNKYLPYYHLNPLRSSKFALKSLCGFSIVIVILGVANLLGYESIKWIIGSCLNMQDVGGYTLIASIAVFAGNLTRAISSVLMPVASKYHALDQFDANKKIGVIATKYNVIVASGLCIIPMFLFKPFLHLWVGESYNLEYISILGGACVILMMGQWFIASEVCLRQMLTGIGKIKIPTVIAISWTISAAVLAWIVLRYIDNSLMAVVLVVSIARLAGALGQLVYSIHYFKFGFKEFVLVSIVKPLIAAVLINFTIGGIIKIINFKIGWPAFIIYSVILCCAYAVVVWFFVLSNVERKQLIRVCKTVVIKFP